MPTFTQWLHPETISKEELKNVKPEDAEAQRVQQKVEYFKYWIFNILKRDDFYKKNDFSLLKVQKLLFLTTCVNIEKNEADNNTQDNGLIQIFDNWVAMPTGHVEMDIYNYWKKNEGDFGWFIINQSETLIKPESLDGFLTLAKIPRIFKITKKSQNQNG